MAEVFAFALTVAGVSLLRVPLRFLVVHLGLLEVRAVRQVLLPNHFDIAFLGCRIAALRCVILFAGGQLLHHIVLIHGIVNGPFDHVDILKVALGRLRVRQVLLIELHRQHLELLLLGLLHGVQIIRLRAHHRLCSDGGDGIQRGRRRRLRLHRCLGGVLCLSLFVITRLTLSSDGRLFSCVGRLVVR